MSEVKMQTHPPFTTMDVTIDDEEALKLLRDMVVQEDGDLTGIRLLHGEGHSGHGLYICSSEYPEEGAVLLTGTKTVTQQAEPRKTPDPVRESLEKLLSSDDYTAEDLTKAWATLAQQAEQRLDKYNADPSCTTVALAEMILSDCGCSSNNTSLLSRAANRIDAHMAAQKNGNNDLRAAFWKQASQVAECEWSFSDDDSGTWKSSCGELWSFIDGGPKENRVSYCHHCGKPVTVAAPKGGV